ncbi:MAG: hypothetical protein ABIZ80_20940, partial [Bryobacteraceae bacterium]
MAGRLIATPCNIAEHQPLMVEAHTVQGLSREDDSSLHAAAGQPLLDYDGFTEKLRSLFRRRRIDVE